MKIVFTKGELNHLSSIVNAFGEKAPSVDDFKKSKILVVTKASDEVSVDINTNFVQDILKSVRRFAKPICGMVENIISLCNGFSDEIAEIAVKYNKPNTALVVEADNLDLAKEVVKLFGNSFKDVPDNLKKQLIERYGLKVVNIKIDN